MPVDPLLNCAAEICCSPEQPLAGQAIPYNMPAHRTRVEILESLGIPNELAHKVSRCMVDRGLCFMPQGLADVIREIVFPADRDGRPPTESGL